MKATTKQASGEPIILRSDRSTRVCVVRVFDESHRYEVWFDFCFNPSEGFEEYDSVKFQTLKDATEFYASKIKKHESR